MLLLLLSSLLPLLLLSHCAGSDPLVHTLASCAPVKARESSTTAGNHPQRGGYYLLGGDYLLIGSADIDSSAEIITRSAGSDIIIKMLEEILVRAFA